MIADIPVLRISGWIGMALFEVPGKSSKRSKIYSILSCILITIFSVHFRLCVLQKAHNIDSSSVLSTFLQICSILTIWIHVFKICRNSALFESVVQIRRLSKNQVSDTILLVGGVVLHCLALFDCNDWSSALFNLTIVMASFWNYVIALQFHAILGCLSAKMANLFTTSRSKEGLMNEHNTILEAGKVINEIYQWQLLLITGQVFGYGANYNFSVIQFFLMAGYRRLDWSVITYLGFFLIMLAARFLTLVSVTHGCEDFQIQVLKKALLGL